MISFMYGNSLSPKALVDSSGSCVGMLSVRRPEIRTLKRMFTLFYEMNFAKFLPEFFGLKTADQLAGNLPTEQTKTPGPEKLLLLCLL